MRERQRKVGLGREKRRQMVPCFHCRGEGVLGTGEGKKTSLLARHVNVGEKWKRGGSVGGGGQRQRGQFITRSHIILQKCCQGILDIKITYPVISKKEIHNRCVKGKIISGSIYNNCRGEGEKGVPRDISEGSYFNCKKAMHKRFEICF